MMKTFSIGGIHPSDSKISKDCKIEVLRIRSKLGSCKGYLVNRSGYGYVFNPLD